MKKIISLLTVITLLFSIFAVIPAMAEDVLTGTWNVPQAYRKLVAPTQKMVLNFSRALTEEEKGALTYSISAFNVSDKADVITLGSAVAADTVTNLTLSDAPKKYKVALSEDSESISFNYATNGNSTKWSSGNSVTTSSGSSGRAYVINVKVSGETVGEKIIFQTGPNPVLLAASGTTPNNSTGLEINKKVVIGYRVRANFTAPASYYYDVEVTKDGVLVPKQDFTCSFDSTGKKLTLSLAEGKTWEYGSTYTVVTKYYLDRTFADDGAEIVEPSEISKTATYTFSTKEAPKPYEATVTKSENTYTVSATALESASAYLVLVSKEAGGKLKDLVIKPVTLSATAETESITIPEGELFEAYLWNGTTFAPLTEKLTIEDVE